MIGIQLFQSWWARVAVYAVVFVCLLVHKTHAQGLCEPRWLPGDQVPGVIGIVNSMIPWDPDGAGPRGPVVVVGGDFVVAGDVVANNIAAWDPATGEWSAFDRGLDDTFYYSADDVYALAVLPNGDLVAAGGFENIGNRVARWDTSSGTWLPIGTGIHFEVRALAVLPEGDLVAGGFFTVPDQATTSTLLRWTGSSWTSIGFDSAQSGRSVQSLLALPNGHLIVGGLFYSAGSVNARSIAGWNGSGWYALGSGAPSGTVRDLAVLDNGDVIAGGSFDLIGGVMATNVARWDGTNWLSMGSGLSGCVWRFTRSPEGGLVAGGCFGGLGRVAKWDGNGWVGFGDGPNEVPHALTFLPDGNLLIGGSQAISDAGGVPVRSMAMWRAATEEWESLGLGLSHVVRAVLKLPNGDLVIGGDFRSVGGVRANFIARKSIETDQWHTLGDGMNGRVQALALLPNGDVVAAGEFTTAGGIATSYAARWNGEEWSPMGAGLNGWGEMAVTPSGQIYMIRNVYGSSTTASLHRWTGTTWSLVGAPFNNAVHALIALSNGDLVAGGAFTSIQGISVARVARRSSVNGQWTSLGSGIGNSTVNALVALTNGDIVAAGGFSTAGGTTAQRIAKWNGSSWSPLGAGLSDSVAGLAVSPGGDLIAVGRLYSSGSVELDGIARWNGIEWSAIGASGANSDVAGVVATGEDEFTIWGEFAEVGGVASPYLARFGLPTDCCLADFDGNGSAGIEDLFSFLSAWFAMDTRADFDGVNGVAVPDIFAFLSIWFVGCV